MKLYLPCVIFLFVFSGLNAQTFTGAGGLVPDDGSTIEFPITVSGLSPSTIDTATFGLETVCINMTHTYDSDLDMRLVAPDGTVVLLAAGVGGSDDDFLYTCFNMSAATAIGNGVAPFTGTFKPQGQLGYVNNGQNGNGTWKLRIVDTYPADQGNLFSWTITFGNSPAGYNAFTSSNLPIVIINTNNQQIVDDPKVMVDFGIIYNGVGVRNYMSDPLNHYNGKAGMEVRGSSSQMFPKKTYGVELWDVNGNSIDSALLGMPKESDWILSANYSDKSLLNNVLAYKLFTDMGHYATRTRFVEVVINGQYSGVYILMEKIKRDKNRVDISKLKPTDIYGDSLTGGYIFKIDKTTGSGGQGWTSAIAPPNATNGEQINFLYEYPDETAIVPQQAQYIESYVDSFETALSGPNFANLQTGYSKYMDVTSFIDMFLLNELSRNVDGYRISTYLYKEKQSKGGKLFIGPPWDYDIAWGNANYCRADDTTGWAYNLNYDCASYWMVPFWWERLLQDPVFANHLRCRWETVKNTDLGINTLHQYIDSMALYLNEGQQRNFEQWPILGSYVWPNPNPIPTTYAGEIAELKNWISARWLWMDGHMPGTLAGCDLGANDITKETFDATVFPNPFSGQVTVRVELPASKNVQLEVRDLSGRLLVTQQQTVAGKQDIIVPLSGLAAGVYLLELRAGEQRITRKIICSN